MRATRVDLLKLEPSVGVRDDVADDGVGELVDDVKVRRVVVADGKGDVARAAAGGEGERLDGADGEVAVTDGVDADEVGAQVRDEDVGARGVQDGVVRMGSFLPIRVGAGAVELVDGLVEGLEVGWVGDVPGREG